MNFIYFWRIIKKFNATHNNNETKGPMIVHLMVINLYYARTELSQENYAVSTMDVKAWVLWVVISSPDIELSNLGDK